MLECRYFLANSARMSDTDLVTGVEHLGEQVCSKVALKCFDLKFFMIISRECAIYQSLLLLDFTLFKLFVFDLFLDQVVKKDNDVQEVITMYSLYLIHLDALSCDQEHCYTKTCLFKVKRFSHV